MCKKLLALLLFPVLLLSACQTQSSGTAEGKTIAATTYPVYLFACEVTKNVPDITVTPVVNQPISCLHDYTLTVQDMKALESADIIAVSGVGLEASMSDALSAVGDTPIIDCSQDVSLLTMQEDGATEKDPHIWMDPHRAAQMVETLAQQLAALDPGHAQQYESNAQQAASHMEQVYQELNHQLQNLSCRELITFHDGFQYFTQAFDLTVLRSIEEEAGSEASAKEVSDIVSLVQTHHIPAIFTEVNGSQATAQSIQREAGTPIHPLSLIMSGDTTSPGVDTYLDAMRSNVATILEAYA